MTKGDAKEWARRYVGRHPFLFYNFYKLGSSRRDLLVDRRTQIVIEGFLHSGNTFAVVALSILCTVGLGKDRQADTGG
jgi:hypothetical protein